MKKKIASAYGRFRTGLLSTSANGANFGIGGRRDGGMPELLDDVLALALCFQVDLTKRRFVLF